MNKRAISLKKQRYKPKSHLNFEILQRQAAISKEKPCNWGIYQKGNLAKSLGKDF